MNFLTAAANFNLINETAVLFTITLAFVLLLLAFIAIVFVREMLNSKESTSPSPNVEDSLMAYYTHDPIMF